MVMAISHVDTCQNQRIGEHVVLLMGILNMVSSEMEQSTCA